MKRYPVYKDSGLPWLGEIPKHWEIKRSKHFFREIDERSDSGDEELLSVSHITGVTPRSEKNITMFMAESYEGYKTCIPNDLVINIMWAWMGALGVSKYRGIISSAYGVYRAKDKNSFNFEYLDYLVRIPEYIAEYTRRSKGIRSSRLRMYSDDFFQIPIICPPPEEQKAIAHFLDRKLEQIEQFIRNKKRLIELLNEQKTAIINRAVTKGINPNAPMKHSGIEWLGEIPGNWNIRKIKQVCTVKGRLGFRGYTVADLVHEDEGALTLGATQIKSEGEINLSEPVYISWDKYYESPEIMINQYNIVMVQRGSTCGKVGFINENIGYATINPSLVLLKDIQILPKYLFYFLSSSLIKKIVDSLLNSTAIPMLSQKQISNFPIFCPPTAEILEIVDHLDQSLEKVNSLIAQIEKEIELIQEYRTTLISDAVTGKIDVRPNSLIETTLTA